MGSWLVSQEFGSCGGRLKPSIWHGGAMADPIKSNPLTISVKASGSQAPLWARAMAQEDRLYNVSRNVPDSANANLIFPGGVVPYGWGQLENQGWDVMSGYSSGVLLEDVGGAAGTIVVGTGGHTRIQNNLLSLNLNDDSPGFDWWQQPYFETSGVNGAELYYNRSEFNSLPREQKTGDGGGTEDSMTAAWIAAGGKFPMGYEGWIFPKKFQYGHLGKNHPHGFRYHAPCYIPPSMTGTGAGAYLVVEAPQGPFVQSWLPSGASTTHLVDSSALWPSGRRKWPIYTKNTQTGEWQRLRYPQPDVSWYGFIHLHTAVVPSLKRVYVSGDVANGTASFWSIDFANGLENVEVTGVQGGTAAIAPNRGTAGALTVGAPNGRLLWFWPDLSGAEYLVVQDLDNKTNFRVGPISGYSVAPGSEDAFIYDSLLHRLLVVRRPANGASGMISYLSIKIPTDVQSPSGYVVSERQLQVEAGVTVSSVSHYYKKCFLHSSLRVIFVPQNSGRMLAFKPSSH